MNAGHKRARATQRWMSFYAIICLTACAYDFNHDLVLIAMMMLTGCGVIDGVRAFHPADTAETEKAR